MTSNELHQKQACQHDPDPRTIQPADGTGRGKDVDFIVDVTCRKCGISGSVRLNPEDIDW